MVCACYSSKDARRRTGDLHLYGRKGPSDVPLTCSAPTTRPLFGESSVGVSEFGGTRGPVSVEGSRVSTRSTCAQVRWTGFSRSDSGV